MAEAELDFQRLFEHSPDVLLVLLPDAPRFTMVGATNARLLATHTTREQLGGGLFDLHPDDPAASLHASLMRVLATRAADTMAVQPHVIRLTDGTTEVRYWSPTNLPVLDPSGEVRYILHRLEDVTERERASARLGELDATKTAFFNNLSDELRTPLALVLGPLEQLLEGPLEGPQKRAVELARDSALRLLALVDALLELSRLEAGTAHATYVPLDLATFSAELAGLFQAVIERAGIRFVIDCPAIAAQAWVDHEMWEKIVANLISNAFKFTFAGEIAVRVREEPACFALEVADTGTGIPEDELPRIFERFHRVAGATGRSHEGAGLGLAVVRELVELHGGRVTVESAVGRGTTVRVELPKGYAHLPRDEVSHEPVTPGIGRDAMARAAEAARWTSERSVAPATSDGAPRARVLVVDDNADLREYIAGLLSPTYDVRVAPDGLAGLEAIRERATELVVCDVMMPRLDGIGLMRALRADASTSAIPIILVSSRGGEDATIAGLDPGFDDYVVKPFATRELLARVRTHIALARTRREWSAQLRHRHRTLDAVGHSVVHDLRPPLRAIDNLVRALADGETLGECAREELDAICERVERMTAAIEGLLEVVRLAKARRDA